jgi:diaminohydroxyphosphoribosylaminopyrimidine deaminase/5-amino-6-(5-phosphoribosylamino)uracil reductase
MAQSMDGKIATRTGESKWISSEVSRRLVHKLREQVDAVMVGANTVVKDDPLLAVTSHKSQVTRSKEKNPIKVIVDTRLRVPLSAKIFSKESPTKVILATTQKAPKRKIGHFEKMNCEILMLNEKDGGVDLEQLMRELGEREITSVLAEGGGELIGSLVEKRLVDKFLFFIAPRIIGGRDAVTSVEGQGAGRINKALNLKIIERKNTGRDLLIVCSPE